MPLKSLPIKLLFLTVIFMSSCATPPPPVTVSGTGSPTMETATANTGKKETVADALEKAYDNPAPEKKGISADEIENLTIGDVIRIEEPNTATLYDNSRYDFPITINSRVEGWIDYFTGRGRPHMERYLGRSSRYMPVMREILKKNGLPEDLVFLALIESGFNMNARSRARAVGPWQFMKATGKRYGLRVDAWIDERRDPLQSTAAAARYLKDLYLMFESWYLASSAYNAGEYKILRAIEEQKTHNFWRICQTKAIRRETKDYVPKLIAASIIAKNPSKYGFETIEYDEPLEFDVVEVDFPVALNDIAKIIDVSEDEIRELNPHLARAMVPPDGETHDVRVPVGRKVVVERALASMRSKGPSLASLPLQHIVRRGDTLKSLSRQYRVSLNELASVNNLSPRESVPAGTSLVIPNRSASGPKARPARAKRTVGSILENDGDFKVHVVRRGESLWSISEKYNVTIQQIFHWNNLKRSRINPGVRLKIRSDKDGTDESAVARKHPVRVTTRTRRR